MVKLRLRLLCYLCVGLECDRIFFFIYFMSDQALGQTADWFRRALAVERVRGNLRLSGYSACGQDGGVQLPREYVEGEVFTKI